MCWCLHTLKTQLRTVVLVTLIVIAASIKCNKWNGFYFSVFFFEPKIVLGLHIVFLLISQCSSLLEVIESPSAQSCSSVL